MRIVESQSLLLQVGLLSRAAEYAWRSDAVSIPSSSGRSSKSEIGPISEERAVSIPSSSGRSSKLRLFAAVLQRPSQSLLLQVGLLRRGWSILHPRPRLNPFFFRSVF